MISSWTWYNIKH